MVARPLSADFSLDFQQDPDDFRGGYISNYAIMNTPSESVCNRDGFGQCTTNTDERFLVTHECGWPSCSVVPKHGESTPMIYEKIRRNGVDYLHMVIGDPADGFAQDVYIRGNYFNAQDSLATSTWASGHNDGLNFDPTPGTGPLQGGGNGSANPERVIVRQVLGGRWDGDSDAWTCEGSTFCSEFLKDNMLTKPRILQQVNEPDMISEFEVDMRTVGYSDMNTVLPMVNKVTVISPSFFYGDEGNFDITKERVYEGPTDNEIITKNSVITAGRYRYIPTADLTESGQYGANGSYQFWDDSFDVESVDWCNYYVREQNDPNALICK